jgi:hypothetical protein
MRSFELKSRATLCLQLAIQDSVNRLIWVAEAERWSRLSQRSFGSGAALKRGIAALSLIAPKIGMLSLKQTRRVCAAGVD